MTHLIRRIACLAGLTLALSATQSQAQAKPAAENPFVGDAHPLEIGVMAQGGLGVTDDRSSFKFLMLGGRAGKVLASNIGPGKLHGNFEYGVEVFPFWQSYTPKFERRMCTTTAPCSEPYIVGGTFTGVSITPIVLRWNLTGLNSHRRLVPWAQGAGGLIWTNHKYPAFGGPPYNVNNDGPAANTSVWNFTPQFGVGAHYFLNPHRAINFGVNAIHISSASLGDKNPGVNASIQFSVGYSWWK